MRKSLAFVFVLAIAVVGCAKKPSKPNAEAAAAAAPATEPEDERIPPPADVAAPPAGAAKTTSGLASKVLQPGTGKDHPEEQDSVTVSYTGWTTDGKMFETSTKRRQPATFSLRGVIAGWTEGLQLMVVGEKRRFWIPKELAYNDRPDRPEGMLVYDVELLALEKGPKPIPAPADVAAPPRGTNATASGIVSKAIAAGNGPRPGPSSIVKMHYTAWSADGKMMESSVARGEPMTLSLERGPPGFKEALPMMQKGETRRFWFPKELVVHDGADVAGDNICFDVELLDILDVDAPPDVKAPPADAQKAASGLATKVLQKGTGTVHPTKESVVRVSYTGWTTDGKMFDSSIAGGQPAELLVGGVIPGWTEGLQLMVEGETRRLWIPEELANKGRNGPQGMLVFDVELVKIVK